MAKAGRKKSRRATRRSKDAVPTDERRMVSELRAAGVKARDVWDLVNTPRTPDEAIPILARWLPKIKDERIKDGIVRALTVPNARGLVEEKLLREFRRNNRDTLLKWTIGHAFIVLVNRALVDDLIDLAMDRSHGSSRQELAIAIARTRSPKAIRTLVKLLNDPDMTGHAMQGLRIAGAVQTRKKIEPFTRHPKGWVRREAKLTLAKFDRLTAKPPATGRARPKRSSGK
jgi:hypothetical protein